MSTDTTAAFRSILVASGDVTALAGTRIVQGFVDAKPTQPTIRFETAADSPGEDPDGLPLTTINHIVTCYAPTMLAADTLCRTVIAAVTAFRKRTTTTGVHVKFASEEKPPRGDEDELLGFYCEAVIRVVYGT